MRVGSSRSLNLAALERLEQHSDDSTNRSKTASKQRLEAQRAGLIVVDPRGRKAAITAVSRARCAGFQQLYRRRGKRLGVALLRSEIHPAVHFIGAVPFYAKQQSEASKAKQKIHRGERRDQAKQLIAAVRACLLDPFCLPFFGKEPCRCARKSKANRHTDLVFFSLPIQNIFLACVQFPKEAPSV